jgi:hypothetical protein
MRIARRHAPYVYGLIQAAITTAIATGIATVQTTGLATGSIPLWLRAWIIAWLTMVPFVLCLAPVIQRAVVALTRDGA